MEFPQHLTCVELPARAVVHDLRRRFDLSAGEVSLAPHHPVGMVI